MRHSSKSLVEYCQQDGLCHRNYSFADFECYTAGSVTGCRCCDVCAKSCVCGNCMEYLSKFIF